MSKLAVVHPSPQRMEHLVNFMPFRACCMNNLTAHLFPEQHEKAGFSHRSTSKGVIATAKSWDVQWTFGKTRPVEFFAWSASHSRAGTSSTEFSRHRSGIVRLLCGVQDTCSNSSSAQEEALHILSHQNSETARKASWERESYRHAYLNVKWKQRRCYTLHHCHFVETRPSLPT